MNNSIDVSVIKRSDLLEALLKCSRYVLPSLKFHAAGYTAEARTLRERYVATEEASIFVLRSRLSNAGGVIKKLHPSCRQELRAGTHNSIRFSCKCDRVSIHNMCINLGGSSDRESHRSHCECTGYAKRSYFR